MSLPKLLIDPLRPALPDGAPCDTKVLVRVQAPPAPEAAEPRPPLHLALVLDRSGSMSGKPLAEAIRCAQAIVRKLTPRDQVAVVIYDDMATVLVPCAPVADPERICRRLGRVHSGGSTNLHQGWELAVGQLREAAVPGAISQVLLLSDGQANRGIVEPAALAAECAKARAIGIGTSTYGLGMGFEEGLMTAMANHGQGRAYYGEDAEDLMGPFQEEFELLSDLFTPELVLRLVPAPGVRIRMVNPYPALGISGWALPSLPYAGEAWAVAQVTVAAEALAQRDPEGRIGLFRPTLEWKGRGGERHTLEGEAFSLPLLPEAEVAALPEAGPVLARLRDLKIAELQEAIYQTALDDDWQKARQLLDELRALAGEDPELQEITRNLEAMASDRDGRRLAKETRFSHQYFSMRSECVREPEGPDPTELKTYFQRKTRFGKQGPQPPRSSRKDPQPQDPPSSTDLED